MLDKYQKWVKSMAFYPSEFGFSYTALGLAGETGESVEIIKKAVRDGRLFLKKDEREALALELGDVLFYVAAICNEVGLDMNSLPQKNMDKLNERHKR